MKLGEVMPLSFGLLYLLQRFRTQPCTLISEEGKGELSLGYAGDSSLDRHFWEGCKLDGI